MIGIVGCEVGGLDGSGSRMRRRGSVGCGIVGLLWPLVCLVVEDGEMMFVIRLTQNAEQKRGMQSYTWCERSTPTRWSDPVVSITATHTYAKQRLIVLGDLVILCMNQFKATIKPSQDTLHWQHPKHLNRNHVYKTLPQHNTTHNPNKRTLTILVSKATAKTNCLPTCFGINTISNASSNTRFISGKLAIIMLAALFFNGTKSKEERG
jgi:hypothetical protein